MTKDEAIKRIAGVVLSSACQKISFTYHGFGINAHGYRLVLFALLEDRIELQQLDGVLPKGAPAAYNPFTNKLIISPTFNVASVIEKMGIVHELTHASLDAVYKGGVLHTETNEAMAYLADAIYYYNLATPVKGIFDAKRQTGWDVALRVARTVKFGDRVSLSTMQEIMDAVTGDKRYAGELKAHPTITFDGIPDPVFP